MTWEAVGALSELIGAIGVIVSLVYLAAQIRQNTSSIRAVTNQHLTASSLAVNMAIGSTPETAQAFYQGLADESLNEAQRSQFVFLFQGALRHLENAYYQHEAGSMDNTIWHGWVESMKGILGSPGGRRWWQEARHRFIGGFPDFVDAEVLGAETESEFDRFLGRGSN